MFLSKVIYSVFVHDISDEDKICGCCSGELHRILEDKSEELQFIPAQVGVIEHVRPKYACSIFEKDAIIETVKAKDLNVFEYVMNRASQKTILRNCYRGSLLSVRSDGRRLTK